MKNLKILPIKVQSLTINSGDFLIFTVGDLEQNILPTESDLKDWKKFIKSYFPDNDCLITSPLLKLTQVVKKKK